MDLDRLGQVALDGRARVVAGADAVIVVQHVRGHGLNFPSSQ